MDIQQILKEARAIWDGDKLNLSQMIVRMGKVFGDICRYERNERTTDREGGENELKKELGNVIVSTIRWCDDLGYDPEECINIALEAQKNYQEKLKVTSNIKS